MANEYYISAGLVPNDSGEAMTANTFYIAAGLVPDDVASEPEPSTPTRKRTQVIIISKLWPLLPLAGAIRNNNLTRREFWKPWRW